MGLAYSINTKGLATISSPFYKGAVMEMQGKRHEMEDEFLIMNNIPNHSHKSVFGVFDGHAGTLASAFMKNKLPEKLPSLKSFDTSALTELNLLLDQELIKHKDYVDQGSCSTFAIIDFAKHSEIDITISHVGDSRAILIHSNQINQLTTDHKPRLPEESERIELAGGSVSFDGRVDGMLAVSRAMGDIDFKRNNNLPPTEQKVIAVPEVSVAKAVPGDILFISCDGFFEKLTTEEVGRFLIEKMKQAQHPLDALRALFEYNTDRSGDNMTAILLQFTEHNEDVEYQIQHSIEYGRIHTKSGGWLRTYTTNLERYGKRLEDAEEYWKQLKKEAHL